jgi:hypothetical protein
MDAYFPGVQDVPGVDAVFYSGAASPSTSDPVGTAVG